MHITVDVLKVGVVGVISSCSIKHEFFPQLFILCNNVCTKFCRLFGQGAGPVDALTLSLGAPRGSVPAVAWSLTRATATGAGYSFQ